MERLVLWLSSPAHRRTTTVDVRGLGIGERMSPMLVSRPNGTGDYLFMHFHDPVQVQVAGVMHQCPPHTFLVWEPGAPQIFGNLRRRWTHSWVHCGGKAIAESLAV